MNNVFQLNKLSELHNGNTIIFCKTDYVIEELKRISTLNHDVVLISGNSDYTINKTHESYIPQNLKMWYATNSVIEHPRITTIPLGIENSYNAKRENHGIGYDRAILKESIINNHIQNTPTKFLYSNFNIITNLNHRVSVANICKSLNYIDWDEPTLSVEDFFNKILEYEGVVCAHGNGDGDNHRIYETLYMGRIPITFNGPYYKLFHHKFPIICLDNPSQLKDYDNLKKQIDIAKNKIWDKNLLDIEYWKNKILSHI